MLTEDMKFLTVSNKKSEIKIALQGAHIIHFQAKGKKPLLWLSETAVFKKGVPIRGGIPICWPWFGPHPSDKTLPNHGFARISLWEHLKTEEINDETTRISLSLKHSSQSLELWPHAFELLLEITISDTLELALTTKNLSKEALPLSLALHTYLDIDDINKIKIKGLDTLSYYDKTNDSFDNLQRGEIDFSKEVDRIYQDVSHPLVVDDDKQKILVETLGSHSVVIWNPGEALAAKMPDLSSHKKMLCIESANVLKDKITLKANETHTLRSIISQA